MFASTEKYALLGPIHTIQTSIFIFSTSWLQEGHFQLLSLTGASFQESRSPPLRGHMMLRQHLEINHKRPGT